jgi:hypothetical protein
MHFEYKLFKTDMVDKKITIVVSLLFLLLNLPVQGQKYKCPTGKNYPIVAWYSIEENHIARAKYVELENAGFNLSLSFYSTQNNVLKALKETEGTNVKLIVSCHDSQSYSSAILKHIIGHPNFGIFYIKDEPFPEDFPAVKKQLEVLHKIDKKHLPYVNLLPIYAFSQKEGNKLYLDYINKYIEELSPLYISYDFYPFPRGGQRDDYFINLELVKGVCQNYRIPFWGFVMCSTTDNYYTTDEAKIRYQVFCNIAYGAQAIQYFTYTVPKGCYSAILDLNYKKTGLYDVVKQVNSEIQSISKYILGSNNHRVWHTGGSIPKGTVNFSNGTKEIKSIESGGVGCVCSEFKNKNKRYLMIVNRDVVNPQIIQIKFLKKVRRIMRESKSSKVYNYTILVDPGDFLLFEI